MHIYRDKLRLGLFICCCTFIFVIMLSSKKTREQIGTRRYVPTRLKPNYDLEKSEYTAEDCGIGCNDSTIILDNRRNMPTWNERHLLTSSTKSRYRAFDHVITEEEFHDMIQILHVFQKVCTENNLTFLLYGGSLLGAYRHFGMVPWDDDIDVLLNATEIFRLKHAFEIVPGFSLESPTNHQWKFYRTKKSKDCSIGSTDQTNNVERNCKMNKWPYIDIFFFKENETHIWDDNNIYSSVYCYRKSDVFPLNLFPFEDLILPVPNQIKRVLDKSYNVELCVTTVFSHKHERISEKRQISLPCKRLFPFFPFVFETCEFRKLARKLLFSGLLLYETIHKEQC